MAEAPLDLMLEPEFNIVCLRYAPAGLAQEASRSPSTGITDGLRKAGIAALSGAVIGGRHRLRAAICNRRTRDEDLGPAGRPDVAAGCAAVPRNRSAGTR